MRWIEGPVERAEGPVERAHDGRVIGRTSINLVVAIVGDMALRD